MFSKKSPPNTTIRITIAAAEDALERARQMPPGPAKHEAMKEAGRLREAANVQRPVESKELQPPK
jgi:hypothetical protein